MATATPYVHDHILTMRDVQLPLESQSWWDWLNEAGTTTFRFTSPQGHYTARRESKRGRWYWNAYRKQHGKLAKVYLGKSEELTEQRLLEVAQKVTERCQVPDSLNIPLSDAVPQDETANKAFLSNKQREMRIPAQQSLQNSTAQDFFFALKLVPPSLRSTLVSRPRLIEAVNNAVQHALTLVCAPAGSGKSTLLSIWYAKSADISRAWVSLDEADNEPSRFWMALIGALQSCFPAIGQGALKMLHSPHPSATKALLASLLSDISTVPEHTVVILDDYHVIRTEAIQQAFAFLLEHVPPRMHFVLATRTLPPLPVARLRVRGQCLEIQGQDLLFTFEEATAFFYQVMDLPLSSDEITILTGRTEGWIAGMQLAALSLQRQGNVEQFLTTFTGTHSYIVDYLAEEVLNGQSEHIRSFLLSTSLLDRLTGPLCDAVLEQSGSHVTLQSLEQANLFIVPLDEQRQWYRYHHLFGEFLRNRLCLQSPEQVSALHHRAAQWYEHNGFVDDAVNHLFASADFYEAACLVERHCDAYMKRGQITTLLRWMQGLPDELLRSNPYLSLCYAAVLCSIDQLDAAENHIKDAEWALRERELHPSVASKSFLTENLSDVQELLNALAVVRVSLASFRGDVKQAIELSQQAYERLAGGNLYFQGVLMVCLGVAYVLNGNLAAGDKIFREAEMLGKAAHYSHLVLVSACSRNYIVMEQGHFYRAAEVHRQIIQRATEEGQLMSLSIAYLGMGELHYYWNELEVAERSLLHGLSLGQQGGNGLALAGGAQFLARIKLARGDAKGAFEIIKQFELQALQSSASPRITMWLEALRAHLWLQQGHAEEATHWVQRSGLSVHDTLSFLDEFAYLSFAQALPLIDRLDEAEMLLKRLLALAEAEGRMKSIVAILIHQAAINLQQGQSRRAQDALLKALSYAEPMGMLRLFIEGGVPVKVLLTSILATRKKDGMLATLSSTYIDALAGAMDQHHAILLSSPQQLSSPENHTVSPLTAREREVLHLLTLGLSNRQIAGELVIAVSTVKWYLKQIYGKLNIHSRVQVVVRARELHLL